jgi:hypothetical protein
MSVATAGRDVFQKRSKAGVNLSANSQRKLIEGA